MKYGQGPHICIEHGPTFCKSDFGSRHHLEMTDDMTEPILVQFAHLQSVLRVAARLVLGLKGRAPISAVMSDSLHWLSFPQRVTFKLCHSVS